MNDLQLSNEVMAAVVEADTYMTEHRVTESWRTISRLRDALVRLADAKGTLR